MKKLFTLFLAILCLLTMLYPGVHQPMQALSRMELPVRAMIRKISRLTVRHCTAKLYLQFNSSYVARAGADSRKHTN